MKTKWFIAAVCAAILAIGCSGPKSTSSNGASGGASGNLKGKTFRIVMIAKSESNPVFPVAEVGAKAAAKELSKSTGVNIEIDWQTPANESAEQEASNINQAVTTGANCVLISCSDAKKLTSAINHAVESGVPVMCFDSDDPESKRFAYYGTDDTDQGTELMDQLGMYMHGKGTVAILAGNQNAPNLQARVKAVQAEAAKKFPNIKFVPVAYHKETPADATAKVEEYMNAYPQITGWAMVGGWPLFEPALLNQLNPKKVVVVAGDALPAELEYVDKGIAPALIAQPVYDWGYDSVHLIVDKLILHKQIAAYNKMVNPVVNKQNLHEWAMKLQSWGMQGIDPKFLNPNYGK